MAPKIFRQAVKFAAEGADHFRRRDEGVVVLIYHRVGRRSSLEIDLPTSLFEAQMAYLARCGRVVPLGVALEWLSRPDRSRPAPVVVTFDDGTADLYDVALPILLRHRIPSTVYVTTDFVDRGLAFPGGGTPLSWSALRDVASTGLVDVGSHTHTHALLDRLPPAEIARELDTSKAKIEENLQQSVLDFAYPKALAPTSVADREVRRRFRSAAVAGTRANVAGGTDPFRLSRSPIQLTDGLRWFRLKAAGGMRLEDDVRFVLNRLRYSGAST